jgi:Flp pilus assembly protein TadG
MSGFMANSKNKFGFQGQSFLELAIALPLFLVVVFGVFDLGRVFFSTITLVNAAREGARFLTTHPEDLGNETEAFLGTKQTAIQEAGYSGIILTKAQVAVSCDNGGDDEPDMCDSGGPAVVTVTQDFDLVLGWMLPSPITITRSAEMIVP